MNKCAVDLDESYFCANCEVNLTKWNDCFIYCTECSRKDAAVCLCLKCYRGGAECGSHKRGHNYKVNNRDGPPMFNTEGDKKMQWGWKEDKRLMLAAHKFKLGNWDDIASSLKSNKTAKEAKQHFDQYFVRGILGRYASSNLRWPFIDDMTTGFSVPEREPVFTGMGAIATGPSEFDYIAQGVRNCDADVDFDNARWYSDIQARLMKCKIEDDISANIVLDTMSPDACEDGALNTRHLPSNAFHKELITSPVAVTFISGTAENETASNKTQQSSKSTGRRKKHNGFRRIKRISSSSDEAPGPSTAKNLAADVDSSDSSEIGVVVKSLRGSRNLRSAGESFSRSHVGLQSSDDEESEIQGTPVTADSAKDNSRKDFTNRRYRRRRNPSSKYEKASTVSKTPAKDTKRKPNTIIKINEEDEQRLLSEYPDSFYCCCAPPAVGSAKTLKLKPDDLELLAYIPERDDFDMEYSNDAERLVSRTVFQSPEDSDDEIDNEVKFQKLMFYNRLLKRRKVKKAVVREYDFVNQFFNKIKNKDEDKRKRFLYNQQYYAKLRRYKQVTQFMTKAHQVLRREEMKQLVNSITNWKEKADNIDELQKLQANGVKVLKGRQKVGTCRIKCKRKRRTFRGTNSHRKATLRWNRFKNWNKRQQQYVEVDSDD